MQHTLNTPVVLLYPVSNCYNHVAGQQKNIYMTKSNGAESWKHMVGTFSSRWMHVVSIKSTSYSCEKVCEYSDMLLYVV